MLIDSHCHIHDKNFPIDHAEVFANMETNGIKKAICVGVDLANSQQAVSFVEKHQKPELFAAVGIHPHEAKDFNIKTDLPKLEKLARSAKVVAIGEIGLDYFYNHSPKEVQAEVLLAQLKLAQKLDLPVSFHVRGAFDDFWPIFDQAEREGGKIRGVVHSFTDSIENLQKALERDLFIGVNGISTFVKKPEELEMFAQIPLNKILLETDAPFLAPKGKRGNSNQPAWIKLIAEDLSKKQDKSLEEIAQITTQNTQKLFNIQ